MPVLDILLMLMMSQPAVEPAPEPPRLADERVICKTSNATGSRLRRTRICLTQREWDLQARALEHDVSRRSTQLSPGQQ